MQYPIPNERSASTLIYIDFQYIYVYIFFFCTLVLYMNIIRLLFYILCLSSLLEFPDDFFMITNRAQQLTFLMYLSTYFIKTEYSFYKIIINKVDIISRHTGDRKFIILRTRFMRKTKYSTVGRQRPQQLSTAQTTRHTRSLCVFLQDYIRFANMETTGSFYASAVLPHALLSHSHQPAGHAHVLFTSI